jgi:hypothetical protein
MGSNIASIEELRNSYKYSVGKPEGKASLGRPRCRWKDNIKIYL